MPAPEELGPDFFVETTNISSAIPDLDSFVFARADGRVIYGRTIELSGPDRDVHSTLFDTAGNVIDRAHAISIGQEQQLTGAGLSNGFEVYAWSEGLAGSRDIYAQVRSADGSVFTPRFQINSGLAAGDQLLPRVIGLGDDRFATVWMDANTSRYTFAIHSLSGTVIKPPTAFSGTTASFPGESSNEFGITVLDGGTFAIAYSMFVADRFEAVFTIIDRDGNIVLPQTDINSAVLGLNETSPDIASLADGRLVTVFERDGSSFGVFFDADGTQGSGFGIGEIRGPRVATLADGRFMVVGVDVNTGHVMGQMFFADGSSDGGIFQITDVATGLLASTAPSLAVLPDGTIVVEWTTNESGRLDTKSTVFDPRETGLNASGTSLGDDWVGSKFADRVQLGNGNDRFTDLGGSDVVFGEAGRDTLLGGDGNDFLYGGAADDTLTGNANDDHLFGGLGADVLDGGAGFDLARYDDANHGNLFIDLGGILQSGAALGDTYFEIEGIVGGLGNDFILGNGAANLLRGGGGADSLVGQGGNDTLDGGTGNDTLSGFDGGGQRLIGGTGIDIVNYFDGLTSPNFTIRLDKPSLNTGAAAGDTYSSIEGIIGSAGRNTIIGNFAANFLTGDFGNDTIIGGGGRDVLTGDVQNFPTTFADRFVYRSISETGKTASTRDVITDFVNTGTLALRDRIDLREIDASTKAGGNQAFTFIAKSAFSGVAGQLHYRLENNTGVVNDKTIIEGDINGDRRADFQIELTGLKTLVKADFIL